VNARRLAFAAAVAALALSASPSRDGPWSTHALARDHGGGGNGGGNAGGEGRGGEGRGGDDRGGRGSEGRDAAGRDAGARGGGVDRPAAAGPRDFSRDAVSPRDLGGLNAANASPTARENAAPGSSVGRIAEYERAVAEAQAIADPEARAEAIRAAEARLAATGDRPPGSALFEGVVGAVNRLLGIEDRD
jgi:hypothetical protein